MTIPCMNETERKSTGFLHFLRNQTENEMKPYICRVLNLSAT